jgi:thioredoxin 1
MWRMEGSRKERHATPAPARIHPGKCWRFALNLPVWRLRIGVAAAYAGPDCGLATMAAMNTAYAEQEPARADVDGLPGPTLLEFGTPWCGWCRGAQPHIAQALAAHPGVRHLKVEDGSGRPLGRSYRVKLWPTLIFLRDGQELSRLVRPQGAQEIREALDRIDAAAPAGG